MVQGRRSRLIIRRVDPWTILKFSALLYASTYFVLLVAGIVLWLVATASGVRGNIESFIAELIASERFQFESRQILRSSAIGGALLVVIGTFANVLMAVLFNLISDVVGGIGIAVEERPPRVSRAVRRARERVEAPAAPSTGRRGVLRPAAARQTDGQGDRRRTGEQPTGTQPAATEPDAAESPASFVRPGSEP
jgi:hypothetical protein